MNKNITIENWTNYSMLLKKHSNVDFTFIGKLASDFIKNLSQEDQDELFDKIKRGVLLLDSEPEMSMYIYAYGKMHYTKLIRALDNLPSTFFDNEIEIIDYGCGQAMGVIACSDYLKKIQKNQNVKSITLIEPSKLTLNRAALHSTILFPNVQIITVNKQLDDLNRDDFSTNSNRIKLHIFSNILDIETFDLNGLAHFIDNHFEGYNKFLCVSPYFGSMDNRTNRIDYFIDFFNDVSLDYSEDLVKGEWQHGWTCSIRLFHKGKLNSNTNIQTPIENVNIDYKKSVLPRRVGAKRGDSKSQYNLGICYYYGEGVNIDYKQAFFCFCKAATQDNMKAQYFLGICYLNGNGVKQDYVQAVFWFLKSAKQGNMYAQTLLGNSYYMGKGIDKDYEQAVFWFNKAVEQGYVIAENKLGDCYYYGYGVKQDYNQAYSLYLKAANLGYMNAQFNIGICYYRGQGIAKDYIQAVLWFNKAVEQGYVIAENKLGDCYYYGYGLNQDYLLAFFWYKKAAEKGYLVAQFNIGDCYYYGNGVKQNYEQAFFWYQKSAEQEDSYAKYYLGLCYYKGKGVIQDYEQAVFWFHESAKQGITSAQSSLGICYYSGYGIKQNFEQAVSWFLKAADLNSTIAQNRLGDCYFRGFGVNQDYVESMRWYRKGLENSCSSCTNCPNYDSVIKQCPKCQFGMGNLYLEGLGVEQDYKEALSYYCKAAKQGYSVAQKKLDELNNKLSISIIEVDDLPF